MITVWCICESSNVTRHVLNHQIQRNGGRHQELSAGLCRARNTSQRSNEVPSYPRSSKAWVCTNHGPRSPPLEEPQEAGGMKTEDLVVRIEFLNSKRGESKDTPCIGVNADGANIDQESFVYETADAFVRRVEFKLGALGLNKGEKPFLLVFAARLEESWRRLPPSFPMMRTRIMETLSRKMIYATWLCWFVHSEMPSGIRSFSGVMR